MILGKTPFTEPDPYDVLELGQDADKREVNRVYRERMRGLSMQDKRYQEVQQAKELLTKPKKRIRADLFHAAAIGWLDELRRRFEGQKLDLEIAPVPQIALTVSEVSNPSPQADFRDPEPLNARVQISAELAADPVAPRLNEIGP